MLQKLTNLELPRGIDISCNAFQQLCATVPNLVILNLSEGKLEIGCLKVLQTLTGLKILNLSGTRLQTGSLKHVSSLCLKELHLNHTKITNAELLDILQPFTKLREHLHSLHIAGTLVTLVGLLPMLSFIPKLEELVTDHSTLDLLLITPPSVLKYLKLNNISSGSGLGSHPATLRQVCFATEALPNLKHIDLLVTDIRQPIFYVLGKWKHLEHLCLYHMFSLAWIVISPALESLNKTLKYLSLFNITGFPHTFPHTMEIKYSFPKLEHLEITEGISESFPVFTIHTEWLIAMISGSPNLVCLRVGGCLGLTDASICKVFTNHTILSLKHITLNSCQNVGNLGLKTLLFKKSLQEISITGMASIFFGDYTSLKNKLKECYNWEIKYMVEKSNVHFVRI